MAKSVDFDAIADEVDSEETDEFGAGIDAEAEPPEVTSTETDEEEIEEPVAVETDEEAPEEESFTFSGLAREFGFDNLGGEDDIEAARNLLQGTAALRDQYRQMQAQQQQLQQMLWMQQQQAQQQPQQQTDPTPKPMPELLKAWEEVPEWRDSWLNMVERDENGRLIPVAGADPTLPTQIQKRQEWERNALQTFLSNPRDFIYQAMTSHPDYQQVGPEQYQQSIYELQDRMEADKIANTVEPWFRDGEGNVTQAGQAYLAAIQAAESDGIYGSQRLHEYGMRAAQPILAMQQASQQQTTPSETKKSRQFAWQKQQAQKSQSRGNTAKKRNQVKKPPMDAYDLERQMLEGLNEMGVDPDALVSAGPSY